MERNTKRIICICLCALIVSLNIKIARAEAVPDVMCGSATVADCVMSYYAMSGCAISNTDWINTLYNDLGSSFGTIYDFAQNGMLTLNSDGTWQATTALETAIENAPAYQSLGLDEIFNVSAQEFASGGGYAAATGAATLAGAVGAVGSVGVLPILGGVTAAYWGGIAIGTLVNHLIEKYSGNIELSAPINYPVTTDLLSKRYPGGNVGSFMSSNTVYFIFVPSDIVLYGYSRSSTSYFQYSYLNTTGQHRTYRRSDMDGTFTLGREGNFNAGNANHVTYVWPNMFDNTSDRDTFINGVLNGTVIPQQFQNYSPDIIGPNGNQKSEYDPNTGQYLIPNVLPQVDPSVQSGQPLTLQDWLNFANSAHQNTSTGALPDNSALFDNILNLVKKAIPNPNPNPNPNPDPYTPPNPTPSPDPDYDPNPDNPNQPDYESEREGQTEPVPDSIPTGAPWVTDGLLDKFPFCIPKDMIDMVKNFSSGTRQAPHISWRFNPPNTPVDYTFNLDLSDFEEIATLLRLLELGVFIVGLAFATRYLIGAT